MTRAVYRRISEYLEKGESAAVKAVIPAADEGCVNEIELSVLNRGTEYGEQKDIITLEACSDKRRIVTESFTAPPRLIILGGGHISLAVSDLAHQCGFYVVVVDDRPEFANAERFKSADEVRCGSFGEVIGELKPGACDYVLMVTRGHAQDTQCIYELFHYPESKYTGLMGSHKRTQALRRTLKEEGLDSGRLDRIHMPVGLSIGAENIYEIAVSIMAQLIEVRRAGSDRKGTVPDHDRDVLEILAKESRGCAVACIIHTEGSSPRYAGARMIVYKDGSVKGTVGGGAVEGIVLEESRKYIETGRYKLLSVERDSKAELSKGKVCGGRVTVLICDLV